MLWTGTDTHSALYIKLESHQPNEFYKMTSSEESQLQQLEHIATFENIDEERVDNVAEHAKYIQLIYSIIKETHILIVYIRDL